MSARPTISAMREVLHDDLYRETHQLPDAPYTRQLRSPGGIVVEIGPAPNGVSALCRILRPDGSLIATSDDADAAWLRRELP